MVRILSRRYRSYLNGTNPNFCSYQFGAYHLTSYYLSLPIVSSHTMADHLHLRHLVQERATHTPRRRTELAQTPTEVDRTQKRTRDAQTVLASVRAIAGYSCRRTGLLGGRRVWPTHTWRGTDFATSHARVNLALRVRESLRRSPARKALQSPTTLQPETRAGTPLPNKERTRAQLRSHRPLFSSKRVHEGGWWHAVIEREVGSTRAGTHLMGKSRKGTQRRRREIASVKPKGHDDTMAPELNHRT